MASVTRRLLLAATALWVVLAGTGVAGAATDPVVEAALVRVERLVQGKEVYGDSAFLFAQGAHRRGTKLDLPLLAALRVPATDPVSRMMRGMHQSMWELRHQPIPRLFITVPKRGAYPFDPAQVGVLRDPVRLDVRYQEQGNLVFRVMQRAMNCEGRKTAVELVGPPDYEYLSTHQLLGLLIAVQRGCITRQAAAASFGNYVARVRDEFELELKQKLPLTDLQVERAASLCLAGQCALVPPSFLRRLAAAQSPDGGWRVDDILVSTGKVSFEHTTALAYCVLALASQ